MRAVPLALALLLACVACSAEPDAVRPTLPGGGFPAGEETPCDADGDGVDGPGCSGFDCDDRDDTAFPGADEICDGADSDCDGLVDEGCGCEPGELERCFEGDEQNRHRGICADGLRRCLDDRTWSVCTGSVLPGTEAPGCDGVDSDCDGVRDAEPACRGCPGTPEICGNGLDDDCDGAIDPAADCTLSCRDVNPRDGDPGDMTCCLRSPPATHEHRCHEGGGLEPCQERVCLDLDGNLETRCSKLCDGTGCFCGRRLPSGELLQVSDCGFLSPCARLDCDDRLDQPCYSGPPGTLGVGVCRAGRHSCERDLEGRRAWSRCEGELAPDDEICGNGLDDDCDGLTDEADGTTGRRCPVGATCEPGARELCGNGLDDDCDGFPDDGCPARPGERQACWTGTIDARGVGACEDGTQQESGGTFGACAGQVLPSEEICGDRVDSDCDGLGGVDGPEEPSCCTPSIEICNGLDDDCDGLPDEGLTNRCGQCPGSGSCHGAVLEDAGDCSVEGRTCEGVEPSPHDPRMITLRGGGGTTGGSPVLYIGLYTTGPGEGKVAQIDAETAEIIWSRSYGPYAIAGAAASSDGSVWVQGQNVIDHLTGDNQMICRVDASTYLPTAVLDDAGDLWFIHGTDPNFRLRQVSSVDVVEEQSPGVPWPDGISRCAAVDLLPDEPEETDLPVSSVGFLLHEGDRLWIFGVFQPPLVLDRRTMELQSLAQPSTFVAPVLAGDGRIFGSYPLRRLEPEVFLAGEGGLTELGSWGQMVLGVNLLSDGTLVAMHGDFTAAPSDILLVDPDTGEELARHRVPENDQTSSSFNLAVDAADRVWSAHGSKLFRLDTSSGEFDEFTPGGAVQVFHRSLVRGAAASSKGVWTQVVDPGTYDLKWGELSWESRSLAGSRVTAVARFSDHREDLASTPHVCGPFSSSPADLSTCSGSRRYARVELHLAGTGKPVAGHVALTWDRP